VVEEKAKDLFTQAEKRLNSKSFLGLGSSTARFEEAGELFEKAGNQYKLAKNWDLAGTAFRRAAECKLKLKSKYEAATLYGAAATASRKTNVKEMSEAMGTAVELFTDEGRFAIAAKQMKELGEMYEQEADLEEALKAYQQAADFFEGEGSQSSANQCLLKVATFAAQLERYDQSVLLFERVAKSSIDNSLLKWSVKDYFLRAGLVRLAWGDVVEAQRALGSYQDMDASFASQRECKFLKDVTEAYERMDVDKFTDAVVEFDSISKLDQWKTTMLLRIKTKIKADDGLA